MPALLMVSTVPVFLTGFLLPFATHFRARGWRVDGMANGIQGDQECSRAFDTVWDVPWSRNPIDPSNLMHAPKVVRDAVAEADYDLVHMHTPVASLVSRFALRNRTRPVKICTVHGFHFHEKGSRLRNAIFRKIETRAGAWTDYLIVINRYDELAAQKSHIVSSDRLVYMPGIGVDTLDQYNPGRISMDEVGKFRASLGLNATDRLFVMVAEFIPRKRHVDAVRALLALNRDDVHLIFAGSGPTQEAIVDLVRELGLERQVHYLGFRRDIPALMCAADAVLLCSDQEGLARSVMEALSLERPVIGSNIRGIAELLEGGTGYLYSPGDVPALAHAMSQVIENPCAASRCGTEGRLRMAHYDTRRIIAMHEELYSAALQTAG